MPIYEFKCLKCDNYQEFLLKSSDEQMELKCSQCGGEDLERVLSTTQHVVSGSSGGQGPAAGASVTNRTCAGGSCTTWNLPGPNN